MPTLMATFFNTSISLSDCNSASVKQGLPWRHFSTPPGLLIRFSETQELSFYQLKGMGTNCRKSFCRAGSQDFQNASKVRENDDIVGEALKALATNKRKDSIGHIKWMLSTFDDGRISISPYDTAWVALVENIDGNGTPQFPSSLDWISHNQLSDGSWGDEHQFSAYDRLLNTLACVIALRSWNIHPDKSEKGIRFFKDTLSKLGKADLDSMTCGFEMVFPPLLERARNLDIELPYDAPVLREICSLRSLKFARSSSSVYYREFQSSEFHTWSRTRSNLPHFQVSFLDILQFARIPKDLMHQVPTALLYNLEGIEDLNWEMLLKLQTEEGSFLTSPSSTAFALMATKDKKCLKYLNTTISKFNGGAPATYPIDIFARLWAIDRLQRLGISRHFEQEIKECLDYVRRFWTENGVFSGRNARIYDLDDTSMGFRLLRLLGYNVSSDVFKHFKYNDKFCCLGGELNASPTTILNLYKASQVQFPGEKILEEAKIFSYNFLKDWLASEQFVDKWVISKDIPGELRYGLEIPWYASLPHVEARFYIEQYSGADDVWVAKTLYRVTEISNNAYLELAKIDYNECQAQHQLEWINMQEWWDDCHLQEYGLSAEKLLHAYFLAAASIFEPERSIERLAWAKSWVITQNLTIYLDQVATSMDQRIAFLAAFKSNATGSLYKIDEMGSGLLWTIREFIIQLSCDDIFEAWQKDVHQQLNDMWEKWLSSWLNLQFDEHSNEEATLLVNIINLCAGNITIMNEMVCNDDDYKSLSNLTNKVCHQLLQYQNKKETSGEIQERNIGTNNYFAEIDKEMQELVHLVLLQSPSNISTANVRQTFLAVAKAFYYSAYCDKETVNLHISKVLFERII